MRFQPGDTVGPYRVTGYVGQGAAGVVYQVVNSVTGRLEAMKILADSFGQDLDQAQRFLREIQLQAKLDHPNIAQVRTAFCEGSTIVLVMELVDGEALNSILARGPLPLATAIAVAEQVLNALGMAHAQGVVHRDVKPGNILVDRKGVVKLTDFGLAKQSGDPGQTAQGMAVGTVFYMAPEQVRGLAETDWRADLYAVGVVLFEMLTGRRPFDGPDHFAVMRAQMEQTAPAVTTFARHLPKEFDALLLRALQKDPEYRFQSAHAFLAALKVLPVPGTSVWSNIWTGATYAAAIGSVVLAAVAVPPALDELPRLQTISLKMPAPPVAPAEAFVIPPVLEPVEEAPPVPAAIPASKPTPRLMRPLPRPVERRPVPVGASPSTPAPAPGGPIESASKALPAPPKVAIVEPIPAARVPEIQPQLATPRPDDQKADAQKTEGQRIEGWMRRNLGRIPRIFRRREPEKPSPH